MSTETTPPVVAILNAAEQEASDTGDPKQLVPVGKTPIIEWSLRAFSVSPVVTDVVVLVTPAALNPTEQIIEEGVYPKVRMVMPIPVGMPEPLSQALETLREAGIPSDAVVVVHDVMQPFIEESTIEAAVAASRDFDAVSVGERTRETVLLASHEAADTDQAVTAVRQHDESESVAFVTRSPQVVHFGQLLDAVAASRRYGETSEGDVLGMVRRFSPDVTIGVVETAHATLTIRTPEDLPAAERLAQEHALRQARAMTAAMSAKSGK